MSDVKSKVCDINPTRPSRIEQTDFDGSDDFVVHSHIQSLTLYLYRTSTSSSVHIYAELNMYNIANSFRQRPRRGLRQRARATSKGC